MLADRGVGDRQGQSLAAPLRERSPTRFVRSSRWQDLRAQWRHHFAQAARARSRAATRTFPARPASHRPKLLGQAQTAGLGLCPRPRRGSERRGHPASLADDSLRRRGRQPRFGTDLEECRLELCQTSERSVAVVARAASLTVLVAPSRQVEPRPGGGAIPGTDRSIRRGTSPAGGRTDDSARVRWPSSEMSRSVLPMVATPGSQRFGGRTLPIQAQRGHGVRVTQIGVIQQRTAAGAGKRDGGRQARHERRESKTLLPPRGRSHKRMALRTRRCQPR